MTNCVGRDVVRGESIALDDSREPLEFLITRRDIIPSVRSARILPIPPYTRTN